MQKTDRRTLYTQSVVKDSFLALIACKPFEKITVTDICRKAEISRATFYLHFNNINDVLDRIIEEALLFSEGVSCTLVDILDAISESRSIEDVLRDSSLIPACQRIADSERYRSLFMDSAVSDYVVRRIAQHERNSVVSGLAERSGISEDDAEMLFRFILHGTFAVNRTLGWEKDERWYRCQSLLARFISGGIKEM